MHDEFNDCEYCSHCQTINDDEDCYCHLQQRVVHEVCIKFEHYEGKQRATTASKASDSAAEKGS